MSSNDNEQLIINSQPNRNLLSLFIEGNNDPKNLTLYNYEKQRYIASQLNIIEAILKIKGNFTIFISGYLWWEEMNNVVKFVKHFCGSYFDIYYIDIHKNTLVSSNRDILFDLFNDTYENIKINDRKFNNLKGSIIVSYTFPFGIITDEARRDVHINIVPSFDLLNKLLRDNKYTNNFTKDKKTEHVKFLINSWEDSEISKSIIFNDDYNSNRNFYYKQIFDKIIEIIEKKLYGPNYEQLKQIRLINSTHPIVDNNLINNIDRELLNTSNVSQNFYSESLFNSINNEINLYNDNFKNNNYFSDSIINDSLFNSINNEINLQNNNNDVISNISSSDSLTTISSINNSIKYDFKDIGFDYLENYRNNFINIDNVKKIHYDNNLSIIK